MCSRSDTFVDRIVKFLLSQGADVSPVDKKGKTAFDVAKTKEIRALLTPPPPLPSPPSDPVS